MNLKKSVKVPLGLAGFSIAAGMVGEGLGYAPLAQAANVSAGFIGPAVNISMGGCLMRRLRGFKKI